MSATVWVGGATGCLAPAVGRWPGKHGGVLVAPWSVCGQWNSRNTRNHGTHCGISAGQSPASSPGSNSWSGCRRSESAQTHKVWGLVRGMTLVVSHRGGYR